MRVVLLQPPFFRCAGSHNDRAPLELCYASAYLEEAGIEHVVLNADYTGSATYLPWSVLFEEFELYQAAVDGKSPLYLETLERVMDLRPELVVVAAGDAVAPVVDTGSPWIASRMAGLLKRYGVKTLGTGPFFGLAMEAFRQLDGAVRGMCGPVIVDAVSDVLVHGGGGQVYRGEPPLDVIPCFDHLQPEEQLLDTMMTAFGCPWQCDFCYAPKMLRGLQYVPLELVAADLERRGLYLYIRDMVFGANLRRLEELQSVLFGRGEYRVDVRAADLDDQRLRLMWDVGVRTVKVGIEVMDDAALERMRKGEDVAVIEAGVRRAKAHGFRVVLYVLLGGMYADRRAYERTYDQVERLEPDGIVVNVSAYQTFDRHYRYDAHFSPFAAMQWAVGHDILQRFLALQDRLGKDSLRVLAAAGAVASGVG